MYENVIIKPIFKHCRKDKKGKKWEKKDGRIIERLNMIKVYYMHV
jgi:hypothetical protein